MQPERWSSAVLGCRGRGGASGGGVGLPGQGEGKEHWNGDQGKGALLHSAGAGGGKAHRCDVA